uniref:Uncharacterized protein n=1 Tax=Phenylobacterium glaciei TaxID=2803784 RepID=A0A974P6T9_9CAUL|nr:hypothetical protein JKL49_13075 [Phenylobacterium glaciei]
MDLGLKDKTIFVAGASPASGWGSWRPAWRRAPRWRSPPAAPRPWRRPAPGSPPSMARTSSGRCPATCATPPPSRRPWPGGGGAWPHLWRRGQCRPPPLPARHGGG